MNNIRSIHLNTMIRGLHNSQIRKIYRRFLSNETLRSAQCIEKKILSCTEVSRDHMTPEIGLHLITERCEQWSATEEKMVFEEPYWAFYWPGGQAITRYLLDSGSIEGSVLDVGSGCGASAVAASMKGAPSVVANDIDPVALTAIALNARLNEVKVNLDATDLIGADLKRIQLKHGLHQPFQTVLVGDMFYDETMTQRIIDWLNIISPECARILIGEPGRPYFNGDVRRLFTKVAEYELNRRAKLENHGLTRVGVYQFNAQ